MRLAWFTPLPPVTSGIAAYSAETIPILSARHDIDVFVASKAELAFAARHGLTAFSAHDVVWRHHRTPYDVIVYQLGNSWCHDFTWPYLFRFPGLVVLHDGQLHHARAWSLLRRFREDDYRSEFAYAHPDADPDAAEIGLSGFAGPIYYFWPMLRAVVDSARAVAAHSEGLAAELSASYPATPVRRIRLGVSDPLAAVAPQGWGATAPGSDAALAPDLRGDIVRRRHGIPESALVVAAVGGVTPEKRITQMLRAVANVLPYRTDLHVLLVGREAEHYSARADAESCGLGDRVTITGFVPDSQLPEYLAAADIAVCLRWPTGQETSGAWLRCVAAAKPTIITDLAHQAALPTLDPRTWTVSHGALTVTAPAPVAVAIDILDEDHSLALALRRLVVDAPLRRQLGEAGRAWWTRTHTLAHTTADYEAALEATLHAPPPAAALPQHLRPDPFGTARTLLRPFGLSIDDLGLDR